MTDTSLPRPAFDAELGAILAALPPMQIVTDENLPALRPQYALGYASIAPAVQRLGIRHRELVVQGPGGELVMSVLSPAEQPHDAPAIFSVHGGGQIMGDRFFMMEGIGQLDWVARHGVVVITPEYRLAPEHPYPQPLEDCYAGLLWTVEHAGELGIDPARLLVGGASSGGGLAAALALAARDRQGPQLLGQLLICPKLDDRNDSVSARQYTHASGFGGLCSQETNEYEWDAILGAGHKDRAVEPYASPARAEDLRGLPPAFIDVGSAELYRDEAVAYASALWKDGVQAELHVWPGGFHGFDIFAPQAALSVAAREARLAWLRRTWGLPSA